MKITRIETAIPRDVMQELLILRIHTDEGIVGCGETYYVPHAVAAMVHDWMGQRLLGADPLAIESHWRFLYQRARNFNGLGTEIRALSAIDLALWDILGQSCGLPVWQLLGGRSRERIPVYNSSGGPTYGARADSGQHGWPGHGTIGEPGPLQDNWASHNEPARYAQELVDAGYRAMKVWILDPLAHADNGPNHIRHDELDKAVGKLRAIREAVGYGIEIILDGHGFFQLPAALRIAEAMREIKPLWMEDVLRVDNVDTLKTFRDLAGVPIAVSEMFGSAESYRLVLEKQAADYMMIDPTWVGGISETQRLATMAIPYNIPVTMHDCTGPLTLLSGIHVGTVHRHVAFQETVRAHIRLVYEKLCDIAVDITGGAVAPPTRPGIGARWHDELFRAGRDGVRVSELS